MFDSPPRRSQSALERRLANGAGIMPPAEIMPYDEVFNAVIEKARERVKEALRRNPGFDKEEARSLILPLIEEIQTNWQRPLQLELAENLANDILGYGPLEVFMVDPEITEVKVYHWQHITIERDGKEQKTPSAFRDEAHSRNVLDRLLATTGRTIDYTNPIVQARLSDGSRLQAQIPPVSYGGTSFAIRRYKQGITPDFLIEREMFSAPIMEFLAACVEAELNLIISGGTSSGKTTVLNALTSFVPVEDSIACIEDPAEIMFDREHNNVFRFEARPANMEGRGEVTMHQLLKVALRLAPKRIIVGECRGSEAVEMIQAMNTGHPGSITTGHSNSAEEMLNTRLPDMMLKADHPAPFESNMRMIASAIDIGIHVDKDRQGVRRLNHIVQVVRAHKESDSSSIVVDTQRLISWDHSKRDWIWHKVPFRYHEAFQRKGVHFNWPYQA